MPKVPQLTKYKRSRVCPQGRKKVKSLSRLRLFATPWTVTHQAPLSLEFSGKSTGVGCHFLLQGNLPNLGIEPGSPALQALPSEPPWKPQGADSQKDNYNKLTLIHSTNIHHVRGPMNISSWSGLSGCSFLSVIQQMFVEHQPCVRHSSRP